MHKVLIVIGMIASSLMVAAGLAAYLGSTPQASAMAPQKADRYQDDTSPIGWDDGLTMPVDTIVAHPNKDATAGKVWTCGNWESLGTDAVQMVRRCEWR